MTGKHKISAGIAGLLLSAALVYAFKSGPDPRHTGAPGDDHLACATSGCHDDTPLNGGGGNVVVSFPDGLTYTPGVRQTLNVVITDSAARDWGFQATARLESDLANGQAGDFTASPGQLVLCSGDLGSPGKFKTSKGCPPDSPIQFIEHNLVPLSNNVFNIVWMPPATNVGNIHIYIAANAGNGNLEFTGDHIYTADYVLTPECTNVTPTISVVQSAGAFDPKAGLASGTWLEIYGSDLSCLSRGWAGSDFDGSKAPTSLSTVGVTVGGVAAFVDYVSPGQVNVQAPDDPKNGAGFQIVLTNSAGASNAFIMQKNAVAPALLSPPVFNTQGHQWVVAQHLDQTFVGKANLISGLSFSPAKRGELITIYGIGFGPVTPATPAGVIVLTQNSLQNKPNIRFGQTPATLQYYGLVPGYVGLYQFNVVVPSTVSPGDMQLNVDAGGVTLAPSLFITVAQ